MSIGPCIIPHISITSFQNWQRNLKGSIRVSINPPLPARPLQRRNPLFRERLITRSTQLPRVAGVAGGRAGGLDVEPEVVYRDGVGVDGGEEFGELGLDGFAGDAVGGASACGGLGGSERGG